MENTYENKCVNIDEYIANFPAEVQALLHQVRKTIQDVAPEAKEKISYGMPAFEFKGILVYFAAHKNHIGFYPTGSGIKAFQDEIRDFKSSKGAIQFPFTKPLPIELIATIVQYRLDENILKASLKKRNK